MEEHFRILSDNLSSITHLTEFLVTFHTLILTADVSQLDDFIETYSADPISPISSFASGLKKDYDAVKNCLLYKELSNGPIEGVNNKLKLIRRRGYGRAGLELLNALAVLSGYYRDLDNPLFGEIAA